MNRDEADAVLAKTFKALREMDMFGTDLVTFYYERIGNRQYRATQVIHGTHVHAKARCGECCDGVL